MAKYGFSCIQDLYENKKDELAFARIDDFDQCSNSWEQWKINNANLYEDNIHQKRDFKVYLNMHENLDFEQRNKQCSVFCSKNAESCTNKYSKYHYEAENQNLGKRNGYLPRHFSDYYTEVNGNDGHLAKTSPSCSEIYPNQWSKNNDFEMSETQKGCFIENCRGFDNSSGSKYHNERYIFCENNRCFPSYPNNCPTDLTPQKRRYSRKTPHLSTNNFERKWVKNVDFEQSEYQNACFSENSREFGDDRVFKHYSERDFFVRNNRCFASSPENHFLELPQNKRRCLRKIPDLSTNDFERKWEKNNDFEQYENQNSCFIQNNKVFYKDSNSRYLNERGFFVRNNRCFARRPENHFRELTQNEGICLRKTSSLFRNNFERKWEKNDEFELSNIQNSCFNENGSEFDKYSNSKYHNEKDISFRNNRYLESNPGNHRLKIPQNKRRFLRKPSSVSSNTFEKKWEKNNHFGQFKIHTNCFSKNRRGFDDDSYFRCHNGKDIFVGSNRYFASNPNNPSIDMPQNKRRCLRKTPSLPTNNFKRIWEKNCNFEQSEYRNNCFSKNREFDSDSKYCNERGIFVGNNTCFTTTPENCVTELFQNTYLSEEPSLFSRNWETNWKNNDDFVQPRNNYTNVNKKCIEFHDDTNSSYYNENATLTGRDNCIHGDLGDSFTETHEKKRPPLRKTSYPSVKYYEEKWETYDNFVQFGKEYSFPPDKITVSIENNDTTCKHEEDTIKHYEKKRETCDNFAQIGKEYSFSPDKINVANENNDAICKQEEDTIKYYEKKWETCDSFEQVGKEYSVPPDKITVANESNDTINKQEKDIIKHYEKKWETCDNFVQIGKKYSFSPDKINVANENNDTIHKHDEDTKPLNESNQYLPNHSDIYLIKTPKKKRRYLSNSLSRCLQKSYKNEDFEQSRKPFTFSCHKIPIASGNADSIHNREIDSTPLGKMHSCLPNILDNNSIETPKKKRRYNRKTPYSTGKIYEKKWEKNGYSEQYQTEYSFSCDKIPIANGNAGCIYNRDVDFTPLGKMHSCLPNHLDNNPIETPKNKRQYKRKTPYSTGKIHEKKWEKDGNSEQYETEYSFSCDKTPVANGNAGAIHNRYGDSTPLGKMHSCLSSHLDSNSIETPKKKRQYKRKTPYSTGKIYGKKWEKNGNCEQYETEYSLSCNKIPIVNGNAGSIYNRDVDSTPFGKIHSSLSNHLDNNYIETPKKKRQYIRKTPYSTGKIYEKKWEKKGNSEKYETEYSFSCDKIPIANDNTGSLNKWEQDPIPPEENHNYFPSYLDINCIETPKEKRRSIRKTLFSAESKCEKKQKNNGDAEQSEIQGRFSYDKLPVASGRESFQHNYKVDTRPLEERNSCSATYIDSDEAPKMKRCYTRKTPYSTENKYEKKWKKNNNAEQCETPRGCDNNGCHDANTKYLRERNSSFPSRFNDYIVETPNKKRPFSKRTPSSNSKLIRKKNKDFSSCNSQSNISYFSKCAFFNNLDFVNRLLNFNDKDLDDTFVTEKSKYVMLSSGCEAIAILRENQKTDEDIMHMCDYQQTRFNEKDSDVTFVIGKVRDAMLYSDNESYECSILMENKKTNDEFTCICNYPQACFNDKDSNDTFAREPNKDVMLFNDYESHACSIIAENQNPEDDSIHISECSHVLFKEINSEDTFVTERRNDVLLCSNYKLYACPIITENPYTDDEIMHVGDCPQIIFDEGDLDDTYVAEKDKDVNIVQR